MVRLNYLKRSAKNMLKGLTGGRKIKKNPIKNKLGTDYFSDHLH